MSEQLKAMKETLMAAAQTQMGNLGQTDAKELGEVIDMIKDLAEATYYCTVTEAMEGKDKKGSSGQDMREMVDYAVSSAMSTMRGNQNYYTVPYMRYFDPRYDEDYNRAYYGGGNGGNSGSMSSAGSYGGTSTSSGSNGGSTSGYGYSETDYYNRSNVPTIMRDYREGRSPALRRGYMESKEMHMDKPTQMAELEKYMKELSRDITEMIGDASAEEKKVLKEKLTELNSKIV